MEIKKDVIRLVGKSERGRREVDDDGKFGERDSAEDFAEEFAESFERLRFAKSAILFLGLRVE